MKTMTITIDKCNMDIVKDKFAKVLKKAEKFPEKKFFTFKFMNEQIVLGDVVADDLIDVVIEYDVLKYNDWYFIGKINADSEHSRNVIHRTKTMEDIEIPDYYYTCSANHCDHCNIDRYRKDTYIIYNDVTKEYKQVGSSCLKDFLGYDISGMFSMYDVFNDVIDEFQPPSRQDSLNGNASTTTITDTPLTHSSSLSNPPKSPATAITQSSVPVNGVHTLLTNCYSPTCRRDKLCYSIACPNRLEQQARLHMKLGGLRRVDSKVSIHDSSEDSKKLWSCSVSKSVLQL